MDFSKLSTININIFLKSRNINYDNLSINEKIKIVEKEALDAINNNQFLTLPVEDLYISSLHVINDIKYTKEEFYKLDNSFFLKYINLFKLKGDARKNHARIYRIFKYQNLIIKNAMVKHVD